MVRVEFASVEGDGTRVPIREVILSDGVRRYGVRIKVGNAELEAGLDTGSVGLRILPGILAANDAMASDEQASYSFGAGVRLDGATASAVVGIGAIRGKTKVQLVEQVGCTDDRPHCAAGSIPLDQYGIQGDGIPGEGFKAILGINMAQADVDNVFYAIGIRSWVVDLPLPGVVNSGYLTLNPTAREVSDFVRLPILRSFSGRRGGAHDALEGCLVNETTGEKLCGAIILDTGAPGLRVVSSKELGPVWRNGSPASLVMRAPTGGAQLRQEIVIGMRDQASHLEFQHADAAPMTMIFAGLAPYFGYSVLYSPDDGLIGFRARSAT